jgi:hypothetical protein
MESGSNCVGGVKGEFRCPGLARQSALKDSRIDSMEFDVGFQAVERGRAGFKCKNSHALTFPMKEYRRQSDIGSNIEDAVAVAQFDAVLQIASCAEDFAVDEARFIGIQRIHR